MWAYGQFMHLMNLLSIKFSSQSMLTRSGSKVLDKANIQAAAVAAANQLNSTGGKTTVDGIPLSTLNSAAEQGLPEDSDDFCSESSKLKPTASLQEIFEAFKNPIQGVGFLGPAPSMPSCTFVSYDALTWLQNHIEGPCNPIEILDDMRR